MNIETYKQKYTLTNSYGRYCEVDQQANVTWAVTLVDHRSGEIEFPYAAFQCREFFADWQFHCLAGLKGEIYGFEPDVPPAARKRGLRYISAWSDQEREREVLRSFADAVLPVQDVSAARNLHYRRGLDDAPKELFLLEIPEAYRASPLALSLWLLGIRYHVEVDYKCGVLDCGAFGIPNDVHGTQSGRMIQSLKEGKQFKHLEFLHENLDKYLWNITRRPVKDGVIGYGTHEYLSPITLTSPFWGTMADTRSAMRNIENCVADYDDDWFDPEDAGEYYSIHQLRLMYEMRGVMEAGKK